MFLVVSFLKLWLGFPLLPLWGVELQCTLYDLLCLYFSSEMMVSLRWTRRVRSWHWNASMKLSVIMDLFHLHSTNLVFSWNMNPNCHHTGNLHFPFSRTDYKRDVLTFLYCPLGCKPFSMIFNHASSLGRSFFRKESAVRSSSCNLAILLSKQDEAQ